MKLHTTAFLGFCVGKNPYYKAALNMPFEAPLLTEPMFTPPLIGCTAENIENFVDTEQGNSGFLLFTLFISILRCFFVKPSQAFIYRAKSYYCCRMLTHFLLKLSSFFFFFPGSHQRRSRQGHYVPSCGGRYR